MIDTALQLIGGGLISISSIFLLFNIKKYKNFEKRDDVKFYKGIIESVERRGIKLSLITDTRPLKDIITFIKDSDLFICEGTYGDDADIEKAIKNKHMTFREAALLAKEGKCKEMLLTHFSPSMIEPKEYEENAKSIFENTIIGEDRMKKELACDKVRNSAAIWSKLC